MTITSLSSFLSRYFPPNAKSFNTTSLVLFNDSISLIRSIVSSSNSSNAGSDAISWKARIIGTESARTAQSVPIVKIFSLSYCSIWSGRVITWRALHIGNSGKCSTSTTSLWCSMLLLRLSISTNSRINSIALVENLPDSMTSSSMSAPNRAQLFKNHVFSLSISFWAATIMFWWDAM